MNDDKALVPQQQAVTVSDNVGTAAAIAREDSEIKSALVMARQFPRQEQTAFLNLKKACQRPTFAADASYSYPRGGTTVTGPSVDLAREAARLWKNVRYGFRIVAMDDDWCHIVGWALDLETNVQPSAEDKFRMLVTRSGGRTKVPDEREARELINKRGAIAERNALLKLLPAEFIEDAMAEAAKTTDAVEKKQLQENPEARIKKMTALFDTLGVTPAMLEERLKHALSVTTPKELTDLTAVYKSIKDGNSTREEHFKVPRAPSEGPQTIDALFTEQK